MKNNLIKDKSYSFAIRIVTVARWLRSRKEFDLSSQVLRAGTGIGSNVEEAWAGISRRDFISEMGIASKEAREAHFWLRLLRDARVVPSRKIEPLLSESLELVRILTAILKTSQSKIRFLLKSRTIMN